LHTVDLQLDRIDHPQEMFEGSPPDGPAPVGEISRDKNSERLLIALEDRVRVLKDIAIAVIEREADERAVEITFGKTTPSLIERDHVIAPLEDEPNSAIEELRRDLEMPVRREGHRRCRKDVMEREDGASPARQCRREIV